MSNYIQTPNGGGATRPSHVGGALATPEYVQGSQFPSTTAMHGGIHSESKGEMGAKLYPFSSNFVVGMPLFARPYSASSSPLAYTPPS
jgi:hypothetical protein